MNAIDLQELVDRELKRLPYPAAPGTLLPKVLAATRTAAPRAARGWAGWSWTWRIAVVAGFCAIGAGAWLLAPVLQPWVAAALAAAGPVAERTGAIAHRADQTAAVTRVLWQAILQPLATYLAALALALTLALALVWTLVERLALGGTSQP